LRIFIMPLCLDGLRRHFKPSSRYDVIPIHFNPALAARNRHAHTGRDHRAGPAGLLLSHLLNLQGIDSVCLEIQSRKHVEERIRAGSARTRPVDLLVESGVGQGSNGKVWFHHGLELRFGGRGYRIDLSGLPAGARSPSTPAGSHQRPHRGAAGRKRKNPFEVKDVGVHDGAASAPKVRYQKDGVSHELSAISSRVAMATAACAAARSRGRPELP